MCAKRWIGESREGPRAIAISCQNCNWQCMPRWLILAATDLASAMMVIEVYLQQVSGASEPRSPKIGYSGLARGCARSTKSARLGILCVVSRFLPHLRQPSPAARPHPGLREMYIASLHRFPK